MNQYITDINKQLQKWNLRKLTQVFVAVGLALLLITSYFWYNELYLTNERRFWMAIENSMSVPSVTRTLSQGGTGNQVVQHYRFHYSPQQAVENQVTFRDRSATVDTTVQTEGILFPDEQFLRYTEFRSISTDQETANIDALVGKWAVQPAEDSEQARLDYISELVTLVVFGNFAPSVRDDIIGQLQSENVYGTEFEDNVIDEEIELDNAQEGDQSVLTYNITVKLQPFARILGEAFERAGYGDFPALNPENYQPDATVNGVFRVRTRDNAFVGVEFGNRQEFYTNYGVMNTVERPEAELDLQELQSAVQAEILETQQ